MTAASASVPTVLVVEDEPLIRMFAADIAADAGYRVVEVANAQEALDAMEADSSIGIVFTDVHMPGALDGLAMTHAARDRWPPVRFLIVSGHRKLEPDQLPSESRFLSKPYGVEEITAALNALAEDWRGLTLH